MKRLLILLALACNLQGCIFAVGAAAGAAAIAVVYDHRKIENTIEDTLTANKVLQRIEEYPDIMKESHIEVTSFNGIVLITGETPDAAWRDQVTEAAKSVRLVKKVYNQLVVRNPTSSLVRTSDTWITAKVRSEMLAVKDLKSGSIKVVTENGTVYLMGIVTRSQADIAVDVSRKVDGVQKVIKIFQYKD